MKRYSHRPFPRYRYRPGRNPHPTRHRDGHSHGEQGPAIETFDARDWSRCDEYRFAIDLFNAGYYWEAHESLEAVWHAAGRKTDTGRFVQGLIQLAAALLKHVCGQTAAARRLGERGGAKLSGVTGVFLGIDATSLAAAVEDCVAAPGSATPTIALST